MGPTRSIASQISTQCVVAQSWSNGPHKVAGEALSAWKDYDGKFPTADKSLNASVVEQSVSRRIRVQCLAVEAT